MNSTSEHGKMHLKTWELGIFVGLMWGIVGDLLIFSFSPSSPPGLIGYWGSYPLISVLSIIKGVISIFSEDLGWGFIQYGWIALPFIGAAILGGVGYLMDLFRLALTKGVD